MTQSTTTLYRSYIIEEYHLTEEPYYVAVGDEVELFEAAYEQRIPLIFKGPTGCGKTRFVEYMSYRLGQPLTSIKQTDSRGVERPEGDNIPLVTIACHEDLTASDLVGRYLLEGDSTVWIDGPLTRAVKAGRHLLPRRDCRGAQGYHRPHSPAHRPQAHLAGRKAR